MMNKNMLWLIVIIAGMSFWAYKIFNTTQAYHHAKMAIQDRTELVQSLGHYEVTYDWWFGVFRALRYGAVQEFEFHLYADQAEAVGVVEVVKNDGHWAVSCINVVNGEYLNKRIIHDCNGSANSP
ncbi:hypothetical protein [Paraglaciecola hydrolytica]|uniref:DUF3301 domain-containing protein n=1 Tax=Paraglaciecola hydrolytica TaxID=1799789 RepID=A0A148KLR9_9ALTE|nr:hypothetical protein [Paraglaciecola hydrolytica]KXI27273.1 hypothetical protein AX660_21315 [Paraglaciecola hydrolytica]